MIQEICGETIDIHGGGEVLRFPHHENECAQSFCRNDGKQLANFWLHNGMVQMADSKMSKSLGNSPDPIELMKKYGADGVRAGMLFSAPAGNDLLFDEKLCEQGRNFSNKLWNAFRLIQSLEIADAGKDQSLHRSGAARCQKVTLIACYR